MISVSEKAFVEEFWGRVREKVSAMAPVIGSHFPFTDSKKGIYDPFGREGDISCWQSAFWPGMMWLMYLDTRDDLYKRIAEGCEARLDEAFDTFDGIHHDVGFMWTLSALADYKITGNRRARSRALHAATILAGRFNLNGRFIRSWDYADSGCSIIDCMMNIHILYWAGKETGDPRFTAVANAHAQTVMKDFVREDGSVRHIVIFDPEKGGVVRVEGGQGYSADSAWTRGQSWAIYGFALAYHNTGRPEYLHTAKRIAGYFMDHMEGHVIPPIDFAAPEEPRYLDTSAGAIAACGFLEIADALSESEKCVYEEAALSILHGLDANCSYDKNGLSMLQNGSASYHRLTGIHLPYIFGDYYLMEALMKLRGNNGGFFVA